MEPQNSSATLKTSPIERLAILRLPSLEHPRRREDMIDLHKLSLAPMTQDFQLVLDSNTRGHSKKLVKNLSRLVDRSNFFTESFVWNNLPEPVVNAPNVNAFKTSHHYTD